MMENNLQEDLSSEDMLVAKNSMPEDDPNGNTLHDAREIRWGPQHAGAKLLASQYTKGNYEKQTITKHKRANLFVLDRKKINCVLFYF